MVQERPQRPTLTPDETALLQGEAERIKVAASVLSDLAEIGVDVSADMAFLQQTEAMRAGLLTKFSTGQVTSVRPRAPRK